MTLMTFASDVLPFKDIETKATTEKIACIQSLVKKIEAAKEKQKSFTLQDFIMVASAKTMEEKLRWIGQK